MNKSELDSLRKNTLEIWVSVGKSIGLSQERALQIANRELDSALEAAAEEPGGLLHDSPLGTMWAEDTEPNNEHDSHFLRVIDACSENYEREGVTMDDITWFWDLSTVERFIEIRSINIIRMALFFHFIENGGSFNSAEEAMAYSGKIVQKYVPSFDMCHPSLFTNDPSHPLPYELISLVSTWYLAEVAKYGLSGLEKVIGKSKSANEEARRLLQAGEL
jgi:hypothetical protein